MPHTASAKKSIPQTEKRNTRNKAAKKAIKVQIKKFLTAAKEGTPEQKKAEFSSAVGKIDKAARNNVMHKNTASRRKSQLAKILAAPPKKAPAAK